MLATKHLLGWKTIGYVETNDYCQRVLAQRIRDGLLDEAPIFGDIRSFLSEGYAERYRGVADVITAGFPCQGWSTASRGLQKSKHDLWPETLETIRIVGPRTVLLENVSRKAIQRARMDLENSGYSTKSARISAASVGAPHRRAREWLFAYSDYKSEPNGTKYDEVEVLRSLPKMALWEKDISGTLGMVDGVAHRMDRLKAIANGQVPAVVKAAWETLTHI